MKKEIFSRILLCSIIGILMLGLCGCEDEDDPYYGNSTQNQDDNWVPPAPTEEVSVEQDDSLYQDGRLPFLYQYYEYPTNGDDPYIEYGVVELEFDKNSGMAFMYDSDDPSEPAFYFSYNGIQLSQFADSDNTMGLDVEYTGIIKGGGKVDGNNMFMRFTPLAPLDGTYHCLETGETFGEGGEYGLVDNSTIHNKFMDDVRDYAARFGLSMTGGSSVNNDSNNNDDNNNGYQKPDNQISDEMLDYYIQVEGEKHIREFVEWSQDPNGFRHADHMQIPSNQRNISQSEFEQLADEYARKNGPADYVPIETWK